MQDPEEPVAFHISDSKKTHWHCEDWRTPRTCLSLAIGRIPQTDFSRRLQTGIFFRNVLLEAQDGAVQLSALKLKRHLSCSRWWQFFFTKHFPTKKWMQFSSHFFFQTWKIWKKAILYSHSHRFAHQKELTMWFCIAKRKAFLLR